MTTVALAERRRVLTGLAAAAAGGTVGALARFGVSALAPVHPGQFPWSTFVINVVGSALLALLPAWAPVHRVHWLPVFLGTGVLGGFTTMSTASVESMALFQHGDTVLGAAYVVGTLVAALVAVTLVDRLSTPADRLDFEQHEGDE